MCVSGDSESPIESGVCRKHRTRIGHSKCDGGVSCDDFFVNKNTEDVV